MKKIWIRAITLALVLSAATVSTFAAGYGRGQGAGSGTCGGTWSNCRFTDADGDGVCDYAGTGSRPMDGTGRGAGYPGGRNR